MGHALFFSADNLPPSGESPREPPCVLLPHVVSKGLYEKRKIVAGGGEGITGLSAVPAHKLSMPQPRSTASSAAPLCVRLEEA